VPVFPVSAKRALEMKLSRVDAPAANGFPDFERALRYFMAEEGWSVWIRSIAHSLLRLLSQRRFELGLELQVLRSPIQEIEEKLTAFRRKRADLERALVDYQVLMEAGARALMREDVEPKLERFKRTEQERMAELVERWIQDSTGLSVRRLDVAIEGRTHGEIRKAYDGWLSHEDRAVSVAFDALCARFWGEMQAAVDELMRFSSELFGVKFEPVSADSRWTSESGFYYKFWSEPTGLATLSSSLVTLLPRVISIRLMLRRRKRLAVELVEMQAGRLRYDFEQRLLQSTRDARLLMTRRIESTLGGIDAALENGVKARKRGESDVNAALARSSEIEHALGAIEERVGALEKPT
jgi:hypothetical protein